MPASHDLFVVDPNEFVARRDALARELRGAGDKEGAAAVKVLRRPPIPIWALNRVAREHGELAGRLVDAADAARAAQRVLLEGGDGDDFRAALNRRRDVMAAVAEAAGSVIDASGRPRDTYAREVEGAVNAIVASAKLGAEFRRSELTATPVDQDDADDMFAGITVAETARTPKARPEKRAARARAGATTSAPQPEPAPAAPSGPSAELLQARERAERAGRELAATELELETAEAEVGTAEQRVEEAIAERERIRKVRDDARAQVVDADAIVSRLDD